MIFLTLLTYILCFTLLYFLFLFYFLRFDFMLIPLCERRYQFEAAMDTGVGSETEVRICLYNSINIMYASTFSK